MWFSSNSSLASASCQPTEQWTCFNCLRQSTDRCQSTKHILSHATIFPHTVIHSRSIGALFNIVDNINSTTQVMPSEANTPTNGNVAIWVGRCNAGTATPAQHCSAVDKYMHMCMCVLVFTSIAWIHHRTYTLMPAEVSDDETTTPRQSSVRLRVWVCKVASVFVADSVDEVRRSTLPFSHIYKYVCVRWWSETDI